jgi:hypothetical protein
MRPPALGFLRLAVLPLAIAAGFVACGGTTAGAAGGGTSSLTGSVASTTFTVASQVAAMGTDSSSCTSGFSPDGGTTGEMCTSSGQVVIVVLTNRSDASCAAAQADEATGASFDFASFDELELAVVAPTGTVTTGTFPVVGDTGPAPTTTAAGADFTTTDASCNTVVQALATSGSITLTQLTATTVSGTYDVTFGTQGSFSGSFAVDICQLPDAGGAPVDGGPSVCK